MKKISASILSANFMKLGEEIRSVEQAGADWLHLDVMDGHFVPNLTIGPDVIRQIRDVTALPLDVHLMISNADLYLEQYVQAGANWLSVQVEAAPHLHRTVTQIRKLGAKPSVVLNPHTPLSTIEWVLEEVEMVLLMSVNPGFGGQSFLPFMLKKANDLREQREKKNLKFLIEMDGGIKTSNISEVSRSGVDVFVVGSGIFQSRSYQETVSELKSAI